MSIFAVHYTYSDDTAARDEHRPAHREFLTALAAEGVVLLSGPYAAVDEAPDAALLLLRGESAAELVELLFEGEIDHGAARERVWAARLRRGGRQEAIGGDGVVVQSAATRMRILTRAAGRGIADTRPVEMIEWNL